VGLLGADAQCSRSLDGGINHWLGSLPQDLKSKIQILL
jgi:hypothetical protein